MIRLGVLIILLGCLLPLPLRAGELATYTTRYYTFVTDLPADKARIVADRMDLICDTYRQYFPGAVTTKPLAMYVFTRHADYSSFMKKTTGAPMQEWNPAVFFEKDNWMVTAACMEGLNGLTPLFSSLQHEGLHQFVQAAYGNSMPIWTNEGLAQIFEHTLIGRDRVIPGAAPIS